jgi:hypothetical protein
LTLINATIGCSGKPQLLEEKDCTGNWAQGSDVLMGEWSGNLVFEQIINGETKQRDLDVLLEFTARSSPRFHLIALGFTDEWHLYAADADFDDFSLTPLLQSDSSGDAYAYNRFEQDGPANRVSIDIQKVCIKEDLVLWAYTAKYKLVDLIDYSLYDYTSSGVSEITMSAQERYEIKGKTLNVSAEARSPSEAVNAVSLKISGQLSNSD